MFARSSSSRNLLILPKQARVIENCGIAWNIFDKGSLSRDMREREVKAFAMDNGSPFFLATIRKAPKVIAGVRY